MDLDNIISNWQTVNKKRKTQTIYTTPNTHNLHLCMLLNMWKVSVLFRKYWRIDFPSFWCCLSTRAHTVNFTLSACEVRATCQWPCQPTEHDHLPLANLSATLVTCASIWSSASAGPCGLVSIQRTCSSPREKNKHYLSTAHYCVPCKINLTVLK